MILWPHCLPQYLNMYPYGEAAGNMQLRSGMDAGPDKVRRRFTAASRPVQGEIIVTQAQFAFFKTWYNDVLLGGTLRFGWIEPWNDTALTNLLTNPGFDSATTGWTVSDCSLASISGGIHGNCLELTPTSTENAYAIQIPPLIVNNKYNVEAYIKKGTAIGAWCYVGIYRTDTSVWVKAENGTIPQDWTHVSFEFDAPVTDPRIMLGKIYDAEIPGTMLFDEVSVVDITTMPTEFRFTEPPSFSSAGGAFIKISMNLEIMP